MKRSIRSMVGPSSAKGPTCMTWAAPRGSTRTSPRGARIGPSSVGQSRAPPEAFFGHPFRLQDHKRPLPGALVSKDLLPVFRQAVFRRERRLTVHPVLPVLRVVPHCSPGRRDYAVTLPVGAQLTEQAPNVAVAGQNLAHRRYPLCVYPLQRDLVGQQTIVPFNLFQPRL